MSGGCGWSSFHHSPHPPQVSRCIWQKPRCWAISDGLWKSSAVDGENNFLMELSSLHRSSPGKRPSDLKTEEVALINEGELPKQFGKLAGMQEDYLGRNGKVCSCLLMLVQDDSEKTCTVALSSLTFVVMSWVESSAKSVLLVIRWPNPTNLSAGPAAVPNELKKSHSSVEHSIPAALSSEDFSYFTTSPIKSLTWEKRTIKISPRELMCCHC